MIGDALYDLAHVGLHAGETLSIKFNLSPISKKLAIIALQIFVGMSTRAIYFAMPQIGLGFVATKILQTSLLPALLFSDRILNHA